MGRNRLSRGTVKGLEASLIGLTMAGCIGIGYLAGNWLDGRMGTTYWTPILVVMGVVAGAREMWATVSRIKQSFSDGTFDNNEVLEAHPPQEPQSVQQNRAAIAKNSHRKPRFFSVPPPPVFGDSSTDTSVNQENSSEIRHQLEHLRELQQQVEELESDSKKHDVN